MTPDQLDELRAALREDVRREVAAAGWSGTHTPKLNAAVAALQGELPTFTLDDQRTVEVETKGDKPNYSYKYVTLGKVIEAVNPLMAKHGLSFTAWPGYADPGDGKLTLCLTYTLAHASGEERTGIMPIRYEGGLQQLGGAITYIRRYVLASVLNIAVEQDDDAMSAMIDDGASGGVRAAASGRATRKAPARSTRQANAATAAELPGGDPVAADDAVIERRRMRNRMFGKLDEYGVSKDREPRLAWLSTRVGRQLASSNDMTDDEIQDVIDNPPPQDDGTTEGEPDAG